MINSCTELENLHVSPPDAKPVLGAVPSVVYNEDCVEAIKRLDENYFGNWLGHHLKSQAKYTRK